jgi:hypothetical protein
VAELAGDRVKVSVAINAFQDPHYLEARGFSNKERFANAIYFHFGGLDLYPEDMVR